MKTIIVPTDFSATSLNAAEYACRLAGFYNAEVWLFHTYQIPVAVGEFAFAALDVVQMQKAAEHELELMKKAVQEKIDIPASINTFACIGELQNELKNFCDEKQPDLLVMGLTGKNALTQLIVGSNTIVTINHLHYPILVIPPKASFNPIRKLGFACDFKEVNKDVPVSLIRKFAKDFNADLFVLNVDYQNEHFDINTMEERHTLSELLGDVEAEYRNIEYEDVTEGISWFSEQASIDILITIPKKHTLLQKIFGRSHTRELIYHTHIPVLCIHQ